MYIGVDIIEIERIKKLLEFKNYLSDIFTQNELNIVKSYGKIREMESLAGRFAAKEATVKALGTGFNEFIVPSDIEILNNENGKPTLVLHNKALETAKELGVHEFNISISHDKTTAVAFVILT